MAIQLPQITPGAVCEESADRRILPTLAEWRQQEVGAAVTHEIRRARHAGSERADAIPREYALMDADELDRRISAARATLGSQLVILGHHYQRDEVIKYADARGDSFKLAQFAAARPEADYILFCGVHFMAESADILSGMHQRVILPNPAAGCSMADMANIAEVEECWEALDALYAGEASGADGEPQPVIPVTYMNSAANLKAFCGRHGGIVCTSSNARAGAALGVCPRAARALLPRRASRAQHGLHAGHSRRADRRLEPAARLRRHLTTTRRCSMRR